MCSEQGEAGRDLPAASSLQDVVFPVRCVPVWRGQGWCGGSGSGGCWKLGFGGVTSCASWAGPFGHTAPGAPVKWGWQIWLCLLGSPACPNHVTPVFSCSSADPIPKFLGSPLPPWLPRVSSCPFWSPGVGRARRNGMCLVELSLLLHPPMAVLLPCRSPTSTSAGSWGICQPRRSCCCGHRR